MFLSFFSGTEEIGNVRIVVIWLMNNCIVSKFVTVWLAKPVTSEAVVTIRCIPSYMGGRSTHGFEMKK